MGCIRFVKSFVIIVLAIIGLNAIGGLVPVKDFVQKQVVTKVTPTKENVQKTAQKIADFSMVKNQYNIFSSSVSNSVSVILKSIFIFSISIFS